MPTYHDPVDWFGDDPRYPGVDAYGVENAALHAFYWGQSLDEALHAAYAAGRLDLLQATAALESRTDVAGAGVALGGAVVVSARRAARLCRMAVGPKAPYEDAGSLALATALDPVCVIDAGFAYVLPPHTTAAVFQTLGPYTGRVVIDADSGQTELPALHPLLMGAAETGVRVRYAAALLDGAARFLAGSLEDDDAPDGVTRADPIVIPDLDLSGLPALPSPPDEAFDGVLPTLPGAPAPPTLPAAPTLPTLAAAPSLPTEYDFDVFDDAVADEDPETALAEIQKVRAGLERYAALLQDTLGRYRAEVEAYAAEVGGVVNRYEAAVRAFAAEGGLDAQRFQAEVQAYLADVQRASERVRAYVGLVQARASAFETAIAAYLAEHVQAKLAQWVATEAAHVAAYRAETEGGLGYRVEARARLAARVEALAGTLDRLRREHAHRLALITGQAERAEVAQ